MSQFEGVPPGIAGVSEEQGSLWIVVEEALYPVEALYGAAYTFIDRCYVFLDRAALGQVRITLRPKQAQSPEGLRAFLGEFANELLACAWRSHITRENRVIIESVTVGAIGGALGPKPPSNPNLDELAAFDFSNQPFEDPLGIAVSWEQKEQERQAAKAAAQTETAEVPK